MSLCSWFGIVIQAPTLNADGTSQKNCSTIDLRSDALGEVRDQGNLGWCYSVAVADLLSDQVKQRISNFDVAMTFSKEAKFFETQIFGESRQNSLEGGELIVALNSALNWSITPLVGMQETLQKANQALTNKKIVAIGYDVRVFDFDRDFASPTLSLFDLRGHAGTLVGRRWNSDQGVCEYHLRDTYKSCKKAINSNETVYSQCINEGEGYYWLPENKLFRGPIEIVWIEQESP